MDKRVNKKAEAFISKFKEDICNEIRVTDTNNIQKIIEFIYEYPRLTYEKEDFVKRKRLKNTIPSVNRCSAKRANGEQCTRRKRENSDFCGTHDKNAPHGLISNNEPQTKNIEIRTQDINGITYWIDKNYNIYKTDDIINNIENPKIIAKYTLKNDNYLISEFLY